MLMLNPDLLIIFIFSLLVNYMLLVKYMSTGSLNIYSVCKKEILAFGLNYLNFEITVPTLFDIIASNQLRILKALKGPTFKLVIRKNLHIV